MASRIPKQRRSGQIQPKGDNKWLVRVYVGRDLAGKRKYSSKQIEGTYKQAEQELTKMLREQDTGTFIEPSKVPLQSYLESWLESKAGLSPKTLRDYTHLMEKHVVPSLGMFKLSQITPMLIGKLYRSLSRDSELAPRTVRYTHTVLSQAMEQAVRWNMLTRNPCAGVELPKQDSKSGGTVLSFEETATFLTKNTNDRLHALWRLLLTAGLRPSEALALQWSDLTDHTLSITSALKEVTPGAWEVQQETKTGEGRSVALSAETVTALSRHRVTQAAEILKAGADYKRNNLIFCSRTGHHYSPPDIRHWWKQALKSAEIREVRLYDTRHTNISHELTLGLPPDEVARRHGHDASTMLKVYAHAVPGSAQAAPAAVELRLAQALTRMEA